MRRRHIAQLRVQRKPLSPSAEYLLRVQLPRKPHSLRCGLNFQRPVQPPSGPMAMATRAASFSPDVAAAGSRTSRNGRAPARSENINFNGAPELRSASRVFAASANPGTRNRLACCADSASILFHRSARFAAAAINPFSLRSAASGDISSAPSSVAFSSAHSNRSNLTMASINSIRTGGTTDGSCSTSVK